jgi:hypothetical protein
MRQRSRAAPRRCAWSLAWAVAVAQLLPSPLHLLPSAEAVVSIHAGDNSFLDIIGTGAATGPSNCIPFGTSDFGPYKGFIYKNVPAFTLHTQHRIAFDMGNPNDKVREL